MYVRAAFGLGLTVALLCTVSAQAARTTTRLPAGAGVFYPADAEQLRAAAQTYLSEAEESPAPGRLTACIVPAAAYPIAGKFMGAAFKGVKQGDYDRVVVMTPGHFVSFDGISIPGVEQFLTPLGAIPLEGPVLRELTRDNRISLRSLVYGERAYRDPEVRRVALHEREHGYEVPLPFLQVQLQTFKLVPLVIGRFRTADKQLDVAGIEDSAETIQRVLGPRTLLVLSANLTTYGPSFGYHPFRENILENIGRLDFELFDIIRSRKVEALNLYLKETGNDFEGVDAVALFMRLLPPNAIGLLQAYDTSGRINDKPNTSVSYAALGYFSPAQSPPSQ